MRLAKGEVKLKRGTATKLASQLGMSVQHVNDFAKGNREGSLDLYRAVIRENKRQSRAKARSHTKKPVMDHGSIGTAA